MYKVTQVSKQLIIVFISEVLPRELRVTLLRPIHQ